MKKLSTLTKKRKIIILIGGIVIICGIAIGMMYVSGVFPGQIKGSATNCSRNCSCHFESTDSYGNPATYCGMCWNCGNKH